MQKLGSVIGQVEQRTARGATPRLATSDEIAWHDVQQQVGARYARATFENFSCSQPGQVSTVRLMREWIAALPELIDQGAGGLILVGPRGSGKDHLAIAALRVAAIDHGLPVAWVEGQTLFARSRDLISKDLGEERWVRDYVRPRVLLISDPIPQTGVISEYQLSVLWRIVDSRYRKCHPTWITANVRNGDDLSEKVGPALADRLRDGALAVLCDWPSYRSAWVQTGEGTFGPKAKR